MEKYWLITENDIEEYKYIIHVKNNEYKDIFYTRNVEIGFNKSNMNHYIHIDNINKHYKIIKEYNKLEDVLLDYPDLMLL